MPEQNQAESDDGQAGCNCTGDCKTRSSRFGHAANSTPNIQHPTSNIQLSGFEVRCSMLSVRCFHLTKPPAFPRS